MIHKLLKGVAPLAALAASALLAGCNGNITIGESAGVPLAELDQSGDPPNELVLAGPDDVFVTRGETLSIDVSGDRKAIDALRFTLEDGALGIMRAKETERNIGTATVRVTVPSLTAIVVAGSGTVDAEEMNGQADVTIAGSGAAKVGSLTADQLDLTIAGSGSFQAAGEVDRLDLTIAGSGSGRMADLRTAAADVTVAGSGDAEFASDGRVEASIMGSGIVTVIGNADCTVQSMGSGRLRCRGGSATNPATARGTSSPQTPDAPPVP